MNFNEYLQNRFSKNKGLPSISKSKKGIIPAAIFILFGLVASIWVLIRLIPKPSRANYPCMKIAFPIATSFIVYLTGMAASVYFFRKAGKKIKEHKLLVAVSFLLIALLSISVSLFNNNEKVSANITDATRFEDPLGPNSPLGEAKGILLGRVVWIHNPDATNANCTNKDKNDAYFNDKNTDQAVTDQMFSEGIKKISGKATNAEAWDAIFRYFNVNHGKGDIGYSPTETIFIKINAVTAHGGAPPSGEMSSGRAVEYDTSPQAILSLLRQLVNEAGVPQQNIYIGDPMCDIYNHLYNKFVAEFPKINYATQYKLKNRYQLSRSNEVGISYSDHSSVLTNDVSLNFYGTHSFFKEMMDASYLINVPAMKGHRWAGITLCAKNHFGSNSSGGSWSLHKGLMNPDNSGMRYGYKQYRVQVDLMANKYLGGKTMLYFIDGLWSTSYEHQKPQKFQTAPFNNDWCSSFLFSLDPVAIESVGLDILQKEFTEEEIIDGTDGLATDRFCFVQWDGVDDYLHQAASSDWWPADIAYDPDNSGTPIKSLGVHEHWNNVNDMKYSRNLGTGNGIELVMVEQKANGIQNLSANNDFNIEVYPNPVTDRATLKMRNDYTGRVAIDIFSGSGKLIRTFDYQKSSTVDQTTVDLSGLIRGNYIVRLQSGNQLLSSQFSKY
jgi:hypothetical protein